MTSATDSVQAIVDAAGQHVPLLLARVEERLSALATGHGPVLAEHAAATIAAGGKRLRPLLVLLAAGHAPDDPRELVACGAAVELVHSATLVHDDVLDAAALRRGLPTVWASGGRPLAVATGDLLFSRAFAELAAEGTLASVRALSRATSALAEGELLQREDAWNATVVVARYLHRCELKTARLFEASCELGALAAGRDAAHVAALGAFGRRIGLAFQLLDDVLDVAGQAESTGKHRGTDLLDGTVTLPLILARQRDAALAAMDLREIVSAPQAADVCERIEATGALADAKAQALAIVVEAKECLAPLDLEEGQRVALDLVADSVVDRHG
ncbi:MAG TPA: polyprenyl synthetase family protein [Solirubrobacteraceae bacterium]|jgi:geranylgeranyl pyrophosphate synthase|nr:polyprenyl synthetase family protein [Solirubrobacteraceae bacterium]